MKSIMEEIFSGDFAPHEVVGVGDEELRRLSVDVDRRLDAFQEKLDGELKNEFLELDSAIWSEQIRMDTLSYIDGFRLGMRLAFEVMDGAD